MFILSPFVPRARYKNGTSPLSKEGHAFARARVRDRRRQIEKKPKMMPLAHCYLACQRFYRVDFNAMVGALRRCLCEVQ